MLSYVGVARDIKKLFFGIPPGKKNWETLV
jgi:hypothetical protein